MEEKNFRKLFKKTWKIEKKKKKKKKKELKI